MSGEMVRSLERGAQAEATSADPVSTGRVIPGVTARDAPPRPAAGAVWLLTLVIMAAALSLTVATLDFEPLRGPKVSFLLLAAGFYVAELAVVHLQVRHHAHSFSMSELPLVVGLLTVSPPLLIAAHALGVGVALFAHRRQAPVKIAFNVAQFAFQTGIAVVVVRGLLASGASLEAGSGWLAVVFAALMAFGLAVTLINGAMRLSGAVLDSREINQTLVFGAIATVANACLGVVLFNVLAAGAIALLPSIIVPLALYVAYRSYVTRIHRREQIGWVYEATRLLHEAEDVDQGMRAVLGHARRVFQVERSAVVLFGTGGLAAFATVVGEDGIEADMAQVPVLDTSQIRRFVSGLRSPIEMGIHRPAIPCLDHDRPGIAAPLVVDGSAIGILVASSPMSDLRGFDDADLRLLGELAGQVAISVKNSRLQTTLGAVTALTEELGDNVAMLQAMAQCSRALFMAPEESGLFVALESVAEAIDASSVFVERNVELESGRVSRLVEVVGSLEANLRRETDLPWTEAPAVAGWLGAGSVVTSSPWQLSAAERHRYRDDEGELLVRLPVVVRGEWLGTVGAIVEDDDGTGSASAWADRRRVVAREEVSRATQVTVLQTLADMVGVAWDRESSRGWLEQLVSDLDRRHEFETALIASSQALLADADDQAVTTALEALLDATTADYVYVEVNYDDPDLGLCSQIIHDAQRGGAAAGDGERPWFGGPHADFPEMMAGLAAGRAMHVIASEQTGKARELYDADGLRSELVLPFYIDGGWAGSVGFADYREERHWDQHEVAALRAAADMIGAYLERRSTLERLGALIRSKDEFIASVSHEVRTPLTAVVGLSEELADDDTLDPESRQELIELIADQSREVANIIEDLLVAARADTGSITVLPQAFDLKAMVDNELVSGRFVELMHDGKLSVEVPSCDVWADPTRVRQILRNLITNAMRYGGDDIRITGRDRGERVRLSVADNGAGIPEQDRQRVFAPYERAHDRPTQPGSVGLGLTVARRLAELMGGSLVYRYVDGWSLFELTLPAPDRAMVGSQA